MNVTNCSAVHPTGVVGPVQFFESIGHWTTAVYVILVIHVLPVWALSGVTLIRLRSTCCPPLVPSLAILVCVPPTVVSLAAIGILLPSFGIYIELLIDIALVIGLIQFISFSVILCGGIKSIVEICKSKKITLPIGSPPFVCLLLCRQPRVTQRNLGVVTRVPLILVLVKVTILIVEVVKNALHPDREPDDYFSVGNIHNLVSIPAGIAGIYSYTIYMVLVNWTIPHTPHRLLGVILLLLFIIYDCSRLFFVFLTGTNMLSCVPPSLTQTVVADFLKNVIKGFLVVFLGMPYLKLASTKVEISQLLDEASASPSEYSSADMEERAEDAPSLRRQSPVPVPRSSPPASKTKL